MPTWVSIVLLILAVLGAGFFVERRRTARILDWSASRGFQQLSPMPSDLDGALRPFLARTEPRAFGGWGLILQGSHDGHAVVMAEYRIHGGHKQPDKWRTLAARGTEGSRVIVVRDDLLNEEAFDALLQAIRTAER